MAPQVASSNVVLPPIRTLFPHSTFHSSPTSDEEMPFMPLKEKQPFSQRQFNPLPQQQFPFAAPKHLQQGRRVSTASTCSSVPSLTFSPSPFPSPVPSPTSTRSPSSQRFRLVPCSLQAADVVVAAPPSQTPTSKSSSSSSFPSDHYPARSRNNRAVLLVGDAISLAAKDERKMRPYRILREHCSE